MLQKRGHDTWEFHREYKHVIDIKVRLGSANRQSVKKVWDMFKVIQKIMMIKYKSLKFEKEVFGKSK